MGNTMTHMKFVENCLNSNDAVCYVADWFRRSGYQVQVPEQKIAPTYQSRMKYADKGDLYVTEDGHNWRRVEVKRSSRDFTSARDWPYDNFFVCAKHSYDNAKIKPYCYIILNKKMTRMGVVKTDTFEDWWVVEKHDKRYGKDYKQEFYVCDPKNVIWRSAVNEIGVQHG